MATARENLANVSNDIAQARTVLAAMGVFLDRVPQIIQEAVDQAVANGATAEEIQPVSDVSDLLEAEAAAILQKMATLPNGQPAPVGNVPNV